MLKTRLQNMAAYPATVNLKQENKDKIWKNYATKRNCKVPVPSMTENRKTMQWGVGPSHETPAAVSAGLQPTRLTRSGNRAFTRRAETTKIEIEPTRLCALYDTINTFNSPLPENLMDLQVPADPWEQLWQQAEQQVAANSEKHRNNKQTKKRRKADDENLKIPGLETQTETATTTSVSPVEPCTPARPS